MIMIEELRRARNSIFDPDDIPIGYEQFSGKNPSWWRRRTALEKVLTLISVVCGVAVVALIISLLTVVLSERIQSESNPSSAQPLTGGRRGKALSQHPNAYNGVGDKNTDNICLTPGCIHSASKALEQMDPDVEPCDDFYNYACGKFVKETVIPDEKVSVNTFSVIGDRLQQQLRALVSDEISESEATPFKLAKNLYKLCMNKTRIEEKGIKPLLDILDNLGGWPVLKGQDWDLDSSWSWVKSVKDFRKNGYSTDYFFDFSIGSDLKNSTRRIIDTDQASLGISREYLVKGMENPIVSAYYNYMVDMAVLFGAEEDRAKRELMDSLNFEMALANISLPNEKRRNATALYNPMTVKEFQQRYPYTDWLEYFNAILKDTGITIDENEVIIVSVPSFMKELGPLLQNTPKRVMANYVMWRISGFSSFFLTEKLRKRQLQYSTALSGKQEQEPRWKECVEITSGSLPISVGALYIRKYFREESKRAALDMVNDIKGVFVDILKKVEWMDEVTRQSALEKVATMATHIGYPDELMNDTKIAEYYKDLEFQPESNYLNTILYMNQFGTTKAFKKLRQPVNKTDWITHSRPAIVNAFYSSIENSIQFPAGILQGQFFSYDRPKYMNYGAIGFVIGHEITHGFDDQGRQFDKNGNLVDWWQADTKKAYLEKARCIIEQYGNYTEPNVKLNLNGINTQGENIADNGGIKEAYYAYRKWAEKNGPEPRLPGLNLSPEQLFWLSAAQTWCSVYRPESMKMRITTGVHSPGKFRVLGPMSNMHEFAKDFNCPAASPMNPDHKCEVW
ncbi:neprilysin-2-like isoform X1 [Anopheles albimanus]|uniref:Neprilysin, neutral endopeptidase 2 n=1 Tax=Anopheles albimanus TaxID=7167 RepID=A0A182F8P8_ANOAL|nr:neprilysin-2-like isoform X1 [Anopheles albimanus]XP_035795573.1 neprilysin-2-like isoform X1 [Anopheles albimanus]XP_035795574.1 neprilysin-2-like isoform X1 [Anopheles albimanus]XP_035795575.1 neprilysin-2-like isoform X1 [Anopheles albimanus]XP_035795577.1 neprilysin-2-like isoform X1 [Anopheles albimanus]XP_035795578.1 neprilysin-2-like isoform X1 [Anopheles albimanus]